MKASVHRVPHAHLRPQQRDKLEKCGKKIKGRKNGILNVKTVKKRYKQKNKNKDRNIRKKKKKVSEQIMKKRTKT